MNTFIRNGGKKIKTTIFILSREKHHLNKSLIRMGITPIEIHECSPQLGSQFIAYDLDITLNDLFMLGRLFGYRIGVEDGELLGFPNIDERKN